MDKFGPCTNMKFEVEKRRRYNGVLGRDVTVEIDIDRIVYDK